MRGLAAAVDQMPGPPQVCGPVCPGITERGIRAGVAHPARLEAGGFVRVSCGEVAEPFGDRVDGRLAGGDVDDEVVDVVVAGA